MISQNVYLDKLRVYEPGKPLPKEVETLVKTRGASDTLDGESFTKISVRNIYSLSGLRVAVNYSEYGREVSGLVALIGRIKCVHQP